MRNQKDNDSIIFHLWLEKNGLLDEWFDLVILPQK